MTYYQITGTDETGLRRTRVEYIGTQSLLGYATRRLDAGWTALSVSDTNGVEVAGIQDFGDGHYEAWVTT